MSTLVSNVSKQTSNTNKNFHCVWTNWIHNSLYFICTWLLEHAFSILLFHMCSNYNSWWKNCLYIIHLCSDLSFIYLGKFTLIYSGKVRYIQIIFLLHTDIHQYVKMEKGFFSISYKIATVLLHSTWTKHNIQFRIVIFQTHQVQQEWFRLILNKVFSGDQEVICIFKVLWTDVSQPVSNPKILQALTNHPISQGS